jgi:hypothetical protein
MKKNVRVGGVMDEISTELLVNTDHSITNVQTHLIPVQLSLVVVITSNIAVNKMTRG